MAVEPSSITTLVGQQIQGRYKWDAIVAGPNPRYAYLIPRDHGHVGKFDVQEKRLTEIGDDLGHRGGKWLCGALVSDGCIYCMPSNANHILKIDTSDDQVEVLVNVPLPESGDGKWLSCAVASDGCIYAMPYNARRALKFDVAEQEATSVGEDLGGGEFKYEGTVVDKDEMICGIPNESSRIIKMDLANPDRMLTVGQDNGQAFYCQGGVLAKDGCIYSANKSGQVLQIVTQSNSYEWFGNKIFNNGSGSWGWGIPIIGADACIYWPPFSANRTLKYNPSSKEQSLVGDDLSGRGVFKWYGGVLASSDNHIYAAPYSATQVLQVDTRPLTMQHKSVVGGTNDSPKKTPDRLAYHTLAEGMTEVTTSIESPFASLCVAIFAPWGSGKTFFWKLILHCLLAQYKAQSDKIKEEEKEKHQPVSRLAHCVVLACVAWCWVARNFAGVARNLAGVFFCCGSDLQEEERVASMMILTLPIGIPVWFVSFSFLVASRPIEFALKIVVFPFLFMREMMIDFESGFVENSEHVWNKLSEKVSLLGIPDKEVFDPPIPKVIWNVFREGGNIDEESQRQQEAFGLNWSQVRDVLTGRKDLYSNFDFERISFQSQIQVMFLSFFQNACKTFEAIIFFVKILFPKKYKIEEGMTKYIVVEFNAWVYSGTDLLWAKLLEQLWTEVENDCGKYSVRLHRAGIALSTESSNDSIQAKLNKRKAAILMHLLKILVSIVIGGVLTSIGVSKNVFGSFKLLNSVSFSPALYFLFKFVIKVFPELYQSRGQKILNQVHRFETFDRPDFYQKTGFMGEVDREIKYLFDYLRTTHINVDDIKRRIRVRLVLFIDDLDRCPQEVIMQILEAVILFLVDAPITCYLAIDSRLVVSSIEEHFGDRFSKAGLDGYQYLEKIVQLPFCLPDLRKAQKKNFLKKTMEGNELDPQRIYRRLIDLLVEGEVRMMIEFFSEEKIIPAPTYDQAFETLLQFLHFLIQKGILSDAAHYLERDANLSPSPSAILQAVKEASRDDNSTEWQRLRDQFLGLVSSGIEEVLDRRRTEATVSTRSPTKGAGSIEQPKVTGTKDSGSPPQNPSDALLNTANGGDNKGQTPADQTVANTLSVPPEFLFRNDNNVIYSYFPMASKQEQKWLEEFADYFIGRPRKMIRICNCYMVSRYIARVMRPKVRPDTVFYKKLLKFIILLEQWPYRMAWILLIVENLQQEREIKDAEEKDSKEDGGPAIGESMTSLLSRLLPNGTLDVESNACQELSLIKIYRYVAQVIMHSSHDSAIQLQRDGDAQVFEQILLNDRVNKMKVKDISLPDHEGGDASLRPYAFNLQRHTVEKVSVELENCLLLHTPAEKDDVASNIVAAGNAVEDYDGATRTRLEGWHASYQKKSTVFDLSTTK